MSMEAGLSLLFLQLLCITCAEVTALSVTMLISCASVCCHPQHKRGEWDVVPPLIAGPVPAAPKPAERGVHSLFCLKQLVETRLFLLGMATASAWPLWWWWEPNATQSQLTATCRAAFECVTTPCVTRLFWTLVYPFKLPFLKMQTVLRLVSIHSQDDDKTWNTSCRTQYQQGDLFRRVVCNAQCR